jgi:hypothetical protein
MYGQLANKGRQKAWGPTKIMLWFITHLDLKEIFIRQDAERQVNERKAAERVTQKVQQGLLASMRTDIQQQAFVLQAQGLPDHNHRCSGVANGRDCHWFYGMYLDEHLDLVRNPRFTGLFGWQSAVVPMPSWPDHHCKGNLTILRRYSLLRSSQGESKVKVRTNIQHIPSQGESKRNTIRNPRSNYWWYSKITVPSLLVPSLPNMEVHWLSEGAVGSCGPVLMWVMVLARRCGERCPSAFNSFELPSWMLYQDVQLLWDSGLVRGESGYSL